VCFLKASWVEQEQGLRVEMDRMKEKAAELQTLNTSLHQELEKVTGTYTVSRYMWW